MRSMEWIRTSRNRIFLDMHFPDWKDKGICSNFDINNMIEVFTKSCVDSIILYAKCQYGNFYYNTKLGHKHSGLGELNLFNEFTRCAHEKGIKIIAYYSVNWDEYMASLHPEWLVEGPEGVRDNLEEFRWSTLCINSPYRAVVFEHLREIATVRCYCSYCKEKFMQKYGIGIPKDRTETGWHSFQQWRYDYIEEFYSQAVKIVKDIDKNIAVTNNYWGYPYQSGSMGSRAAGALKHADFSTGEAYTDWTGLNAPGIFSKYLRGAGNGKPFEVLIGRFYNTWDYTLKSKTQLAYEAYTVIANGGTVTMDDEPYHDGAIEEETYMYLKDIFSVVNERSEALDNVQPLKYAAILHSQSTKDYLNNYGDVSFIPPIAGAYKVFRDLHMPVGFLFDESLAEDVLKDYKILILADVGCLSKDHGHMIRRFVADGGTLISSYRKSLFVHNVCSKEDFELRDVLGVGFESFSSFTTSYFKLEEGSISWGAFECINTKRPIGFNSGYIKVKKHANTEIMAYIIDPICETNGKEFFHNNLPSPYIKTSFPAITVNKYGRGHSIYFASEIFSAFARKGQREVKHLVKALLQITAPQPQIKVECPSSVEGIVNKVKDTDLVIHLLNPHMDLPVCYGHMEVFNGYYDRTLECMEDVIQLNNLKASIKIPEGKTVKSIRVFEGPKISSFSINSQYCEFTIPEVNLWQTIMVELL